MGTYASYAESYFFEYCGITVLFTAWWLAILLAYLVTVTFDITEIRILDQLAKIGVCTYLLYVVNLLTASGLDLVPWCWSIRA